MQNLALYLSCVVIWGSTWIAVKMQLGVVEPLVSISYRFAMAALLMLAFCAMTNRLKTLRFTRKQFGFLALQGFLLFFFNYWLFYAMTNYVISALVAVCFSTISIMNIFNQALFFRIPVRKQVIVGSLLGFIGIVFVFWHEVQTISIHDDSFKGIMLGLAATYSASLGNILSYRNSRDKMPVLETNTLAMGIGAASSMIVALLLQTPITFDTGLPYVGSLLYLSVFGSVIAFMCFLTLIARIGADRAGYSAVLIPIVALAISTFYEGYIWTSTAFIGVAFVIAGNIFALIKPSHVRSLLLLFKKNPA